MIQEFVNRFIERQAEVKAKIAASRPSDYTSIVKLVVETVTTDEYEAIDPDRIYSIDDGDYQGTLVFVIGGKGYQPYDYWYVKVSYGSCSGCDTLQAIEETWDDEAPLTAREVEGYYTLCLHVAQGLKKMGDE